MVRTAGGIRVSAGKSSKKSGGSAPSPSVTAGSKSKSGSSSTKLPPIPVQETPSWQKPITNFFKQTSPLKSKENTFDTEISPDDLKEAGPSAKKCKLNGENEEESENKTTNESPLEKEDEEITKNEYCGEDEKENCAEERDESKPGSSKD